MTEEIIPYHSRPGAFPVFGVGYPKSGSTSVLRAMEILGWPREKIAYLPTDAEERAIFRCFVPAIIEGNIEAGLPPLDGLPYLVAADRVHRIYAELAAHYPDARFLITYRDPHEIALSAWRHARRQMERGDFYPPQWEDFEAVAALAAAHYKAVLQWALRDGIRERSLVLRICDGEGWETLCPFLGLPIPKATFPRANAS